MRTPPLLSALSHPRLTSCERGESARVAPQPLGLPTSLACSVVLFSRVANEIRDPIVSSGLKPQPVAVLPAGVTSARASYVSNAHCNCQSTSRQLAQLHGGLYNAMLSLKLALHESYLFPVYV
eukprot:COSAG02_NODE_74_length_41878_cov_9.737954_3_plen_123_part_00